MSTIKSSAENLTLNADGSGNDIIFQSNGSNVATLDQAGVLTATTFAGSGASLTALNATNLGSGTVPTARLGSGTASSSTVLYGDQTYKAEPTGGKVLQVVSYIVDDSSAISTTSGTLISTSVTLDITPAATSSKILILFNVGECYAASDWSLYRDGSSVSTMGGQNFSAIARTITSNFIDSPNTTSAVTYTIYQRASTGTGYLKNNSPNTVSLIAMEIGA